MPNANVEVTDAGIRPKDSSPPVETRRQADPEQQYFRGAGNARHNHGQLCRRAHGDSPPDVYGGWLLWINKTSR